ncbi:MAG: hypothetical protein WEB60_06760 [Terrimicrobiaceae bacterium]
MNKSTLFPLVASLLLVLGVSPLVAQDPDSPLQVINGDFSDLEGLAGLQQAGWYSGVPMGWTAAPPPENQDNFYAVRNMGAAGFVANLHVLTRIKPEFQPLEQEVGVLAEMSDVTLTFDTTGLKDEDFSMGAAIANARGQGPAAILAKANFEAAGAQRLVATKVPAGTWVAIRFWAVKGFPGIGNVTIKVTPSP